jgi:glycosyltransferase involved in cell wall biosynthesis
MSAPRISLITPSYQQAAYLEECIASIHEEGYGGSVEHIVVDGGSTDGSRAIIERHAEKFAWWCSEKDKGQSDAINKGLAHATGDVFGWLNSDDALLAGVLADVQHYFREDPALLVFGGKVNHFNEHGGRTFDALNNANDPDQLFNEPVINQPATFWRMDVIRAIGGVDTRLGYVMDLELWWQVLFRYGTDHLRFEPIVLAAFRIHDESKTSTAHVGFLDETASLLHGLCLRSDNPDLARVLATGHDLREGLRGIPVTAAHKERVRAMTLRFLLKWNHTIHREEQFRMMSAFRELDPRSYVLNSEQQERLKKIDTQLRGSWNLFRVKRKLKHLFG